MKLRSVVVASFAAAAFAFAGCDDEAPRVDAGPLPAFDASVEAGGMMPSAEHGGCIERPALPAPPMRGLPCELLPPGFAAP